MERININLIPKEFTAEQIKRSKFIKVQAIGVSTILFMVFLASLVIALRILQSRNIQRVQSEVEQTQQVIEGFEGRQTSIFIIKDRLTTIGKYFGIPSQQADMYQLLEEILPPQFSVTSLSVDQKGSVSILGFLPDAGSLEDLVKALTSKDRNEDKISQISFENLSRGRDGLYRIGLKVTPKK